MTCHTYTRSGTRLQNEGSFDGALPTIGFEPLISPDLV